MRVSLVLPAAVALLVAAASASAQHVEGRVVDDATGEPIPGATVTLFSSDGGAAARALTDAQGGFRLAVTQPGRFSVGAERVGYQPARSGGMTVTPDDIVRVEVRMAAGAVLLAPLTVVAASRPVTRNAGMAGFEYRQRRGWGRYMGPEQIQRLTGWRPSDLLQTIPFVQVRGGPERVVTLRRRAGGVNSGPRCVPTVYVDGFAADGLSVDEAVGGRDLAAIEVYDSPSLAPIEFQPRDRDRACGVVVVWTR